jgi:hypothetical protein
MSNEPPFITAWDVKPGDRYEWAGHDVRVIRTFDVPGDDRYRVVVVDTPMGEQQPRYNRGERLRDWRPNDE